MEIFAPSAVTKVEPTAWSNLTQVIARRKEQIQTQLALVMPVRGIRNLIEQYSGSNVFTSETFRLVIAHSRAKTMSRKNQKLGRRGVYEIIPCSIMADSEQVKIISDGPIMSLADWQFPQKCPNCAGQDKCQHTIQLQLYHEKQWQCLWFIGIDASTALYSGLHIKPEEDGENDGSSDIQWRDGVGTWEELRSLWTWHQLDKPWSFRKKTIFNPKHKDNDTCAVMSITIRPNMDSGAALIQTIKRQFEELWITVWCPRYHPTLDEAKRSLDRHFLLQYGAAEVNEGKVIRFLFPPSYAAPYSDEIHRLDIAAAETTNLTVVHSHEYHPDIIAMEDYRGKSQNGLIYLIDLYPEVKPIHFTGTVYIS